MKTASAKQKARLLQQWIRDQILLLFPELTKDDVRSTSMGASGEDVLLSSAARLLFNYSVECKNKESINVWADFTQCSDNAPPTTNPLLIIKKNRREPLAVVEAQHFLALIKELKCKSDNKCSCKATK